MQEHESLSEGFYIRLNPVDTTVRPLPYVNVTLEERSSETLGSRSDRPHQYLTVAIEDTEHMVAGDIHQAHANFSAQLEERHMSHRLDTQKCRNTSRNQIAPM